MCFHGILKQRKTEGPLYAPSLLPRGNALLTTFSIMMMRWVVNTALIDSSGRKISLHVKSTTAATLSLMGAKYHPQRWKVPLNWYVAAAPWLQAETVPMGSWNKVKLKIMYESMIRVKWFWLPITLLKINSQRSLSCDLSIKNICFREKVATLHKDYSTLTCNSCTYCFYAGALNFMCAYPLPWK